MMRREVLWFLFGLFGFLVSSCQGKTYAAVKGLEGISDTNHSILLKSEASQAAPIEVLIINASQFSVYFPQDYGLQVFAWMQDEWQRLPARAFPAPSQGIVLPPFPEGGMEQVLIYPALPSGEERAITLRLIIRGRKKEATGEPVGAYLDVTLHSTR